MESYGKGSSVARGWEGGLSLPIGLKRMQNNVFLAILMLIFALKTKIAPPPYWKLGVRVDLRPLDFGQENALNFGEDLFFWRSLHFEQKIHLNLIQDC